LYLACTLLLYPIARLVGGVSLREFSKAVSSAQAAALSTRSSLASLPALIEAADVRLGLPPSVTGFVLPLAVSVFRAATPITVICSTLFLGRLYGVPISVTQLLMMAVISLFFSFTAPGIPSGGLFIMAPVFASVGLPAEGVGILIAIDIFPDAARTVLNVTGDAVTAVIVANRYDGTKSTAHSRTSFSDAA
jgi:Na+/H+-dicarboxylate symporter